MQNKLASAQISFEVQPRVFYEGFKNHVLYVEDVSSASGAAVWKDVFDADISTPGAPKITIAKEAVVSSAGPESIRLHLIKGETHDTNSRTPDQYIISTFEETDVAISLPPVVKPPQETVPVAQLTTLELFRQKYNPNKELARWYWPPPREWTAMTTVPSWMTPAGSGYSRTWTGWPQPPTTGASCRHCIRMSEP